MRAPRIPGKRCGTRLVALMCASSPDPYAHRLAGTAHPRPSSRLASRTAGLGLASATKSEPRPCSPPRGDTRRAAVALLPMRSARRAQRQAVTFPPIGADGGVLNANEDSRVPGRPVPPRTGVCMDARETPAKDDLREHGSISRRRLLCPGGAGFRGRRSSAPVLVQRSGRIGSSTAAREHEPEEQGSDLVVSG